MPLRTAVPLLFLLFLALAGALPARAEPSVTLRGSPASMQEQHRIALENDFSFLRTPGQVRRLVDLGALVELEGNADYEVAGAVSYPFARPEVRLFVERLAAQYRAGCGEPLVVTSLTRPVSGQPGNAHRLSVHPAGMAVDLRVSDSAACRSWLEATLLSLESRDLLDATRERRPPHYHIALFPREYREHVEAQLARDSMEAATAEATVVAEAASALQAGALPGLAPAEEEDAAGTPPRRPWSVAVAVALVGGFLGVGWVRRRLSRSAR